MNPTDATHAIQAYCHGHLDEMLSTLETIVNIDSCSPNPAGVEQVADVLELELLRAGFDTERTAMPPADDYQEWMAEFLVPELGSIDKVARHLVGKKAGTGDGHALLIGHMDTAFPFGEAAANPFRIDGDRAHGCAVADMKSGLIVTLYAIKALTELGLPAPRLTVLYNSDEQAGSLTTRPLIERIVAEGADWSITTEMGRAEGGILKRRASLGWGVVDVRGIERHVGTGFWESASAVIALAKKTIKLESLSDRERGRIVNVGEFHGGTRRNLVAGQARAKLDIRARTDADWEALAVEIREILAEESVPGTQADCRLFNHRPAMEPTERTEALMGTVQRSADDLGQTIAFVETSGGSDASFTAALGVPSLCAFGPVGGNTMTRDEFIFVDSLPERAALLATTLHRLAIGE